MAEDVKPSRYSSSFLGGLAQACAFMAAPFLTAGIGLGVRHMFPDILKAGITATADAGIGWGIISACFAIGAAFAGAAVMVNSKANAQRKFEQNTEVERCVEKALDAHQPDLSLGQHVAQEKKWVHKITAERQRAPSAGEIAH